jgi:hypothetical protein
MLFRSAIKAQAVGEKASGLADKAVEVQKDVHDGSRSDMGLKGHDSWDCLLSAVSR